MDALTPNDAACLRILAGSSFGPGVNLRLPSGRVLTPDEAQAFTSAYAPAASEERPDDHEDGAERQATDRSRFLEACRPATAAEYAAWLSGYLLRGGNVTHPYDRPMVGFYVMERYATPPELYGASLVNVIVPASVPLDPAQMTRTFHGCSGHNSFYFMDGFEVVSLTVPSFTDVEPLVA